jgi:hypothetical protein
MIGVTNALRRIVTVNLPVVPTFTAPATMTSSNTLGGSGTFSFQFNSNERTCTTSVTGSVSGSGSSSFTYFGAGDPIDPSDYEVMVTLGTSVGFSNITTAGGSATLGVWISLSSSPLYSFSCSDRRGGSRPITVAIRHKVSTGTTASTNITMNQTSNAVSPSFSGIGGTTSVIRTTTDTYLGVFLDSASSANAGQIRTYKSTTLFTQTGWSFSTGAIPESEYEVSTAATLVTPSGGLITFNGGAGTYSDISTERAKSPAYNSGYGTFWSRLGTEPAATGRMTIVIRHKLDPTKNAVANFDFSAS